MQFTEDAAATVLVDMGDDSFEREVSSMGCDKNSSDESDGERFDHTDSSDTDSDSDEDDESSSDSESEDITKTVNKRLLENVALAVHASGVHPKSQAMATVAQRMTLAAILTTF
jgi:hypothetical protein